MSNLLQGPAAMGDAGRTAAFRADQARLLYGGMPVSLAANAVLAMLLVYVQWGVAAHAGGWLAVMGVVLAVRAALYFGHRRDGFSADARTSVWLMRFRAGAAVTGGVWGAAALLLFPEGDLVHQVFVTFVLAGVSAGAITSLAVDRVSALCFVVPALVPLILVLVAAGDSVSMAMGFMVALYLAFVSHSVTQTARHLHDAIQLRLEAVERRRELADSESRFRLMADGAPALIWAADERNLGTWFNRRWLEYTGRSLEQELGFGWAAGVHPADLERCVACCNDAFRVRRPFEMEFRLRRADGSYGWVADTGIPQFNVDGGFSGYVGYCWDITDRKHAEAELQRQKRMGEIIAQARSEFIGDVRHCSLFETVLSGLLAIAGAGQGFIVSVRSMPEGGHCFENYQFVDMTVPEAPRVTCREGLLPAAESSAFEVLLGKISRFSGGGGADSPPGGNLPGSTLPADAFQVIPVYFGNDLMALVGLAGGTGESGPAGTGFAQPLFSALGSLISALRARDQARRDQGEILRLSRVASETTNAVIITDIRGRVEWVNEGFARLTGYGLEEVLGRKPGALLQGTETDPAAVLRMREACVHGRSFNEDIVNYTKSGEAYWIRINCNPLHDPEGRLQGFMAIESDVTQEKVDSERIRKSEWRLNAVIEGARIGTWEWNVQTGETVFNERWAEMVGYRLEELQPVSIQTWLRLVHPDDSQESAETLRRHFSGESAYYDAQCRMRHKDGHWIWVRDRGRVHSWTPDGRPLMMFGTHADITGQKGVELALRHESLRLRSLFELSPIGIALNDYETGRFVDVNEALVAPTGYTREELLRLSYRDITPGDYESRQTDEMAKLGKTGRYGPYQKEYLRKDGSRYPVLLNGVLIEDAAGKKLVWSIIEDISERSRIERMKDEFIATVSHELRTPLTAISGALGLLGRGVLQPESPESRKMLDIAFDNSRRLARLIDDLLDSERLASGKMVFDMQTIPLLPQLEQAVGANQPYADQYGIRYALLQGADEAAVRVDVLRLQQVLSNLLSNAAKFSPKGEVVEVAVHARDNIVRVEVRDRGAGVPLEFRSRLFEKFVQGDAGDTRSRGGSGLGLAISKELVEGMGGAIGFEPAAGGGSVFYFELPVFRQHGNPGGGR